MGTTAWVVSGGGRFTDPWHPFAETTAQLEAAVRGRGWAVEVSADADVALAALSRAPLPSLLIINIGWYGPERLSEPATDGLVSGLQQGLPTLLVHSTLTAFPDWPLWGEIAGGGWTYGTTYHPDYDQAVVSARPDHPLTAGLDQLEVSDERYTDLWVAPSSRVFLDHDEVGATYPLAWTHTWGRSPVVADALGHDAASYRAAGRAVLLDRELDWLTATS